jgi:predicted GNAT superfamily acetyltransferase
MEPDMTRHAPRAFPYEIRPIEAIEHLHACEAVAKLVWQVDDREIVPASHLKALAHAGGLVAGAFQDGALVGFLVGFLARHDGDPRVELHSHLMGVLPEHRRAGVARRLKWFQRAWCLDRGIDHVVWTFDPLQAATTRLNLEVLGAVGERYERDFYGALGGVRFGSLPTDRLLARWSLRAPHVERLAGDAGLLPPATPTHASPAQEGDLPWALASRGDDRPGAPQPDLASPHVRVAVPRDLPALLHRDPEVALAWRYAVREAMEAYVDRGYRAVRFLGGAVVLSADPGDLDR